MPKETFFNLPEAKREAITAIAVEEFADHAYAAVSISRIVARAGIAKGSFYQYFEDKEDLYNYLLGLIVEKKMAMFSMDQPDPEHVGVFKYLHWIAENGVRFELTYPKLTRMGYRAFTANILPQAFQTRAHQETMAFYRKLVVLGQEQGDISPDINTDLAASIFDIALSSLSQTLISYIVESDPQRPEHEPLFARPEILKLYHQGLDILERGLRPPQPVQDLQATPPQAMLSTTHEEVVG